MSETKSLYHRTSSLIDFDEDEYDKVIEKYSVKKIEKTRPIYEFEPDSPVEIITGAVTKIGHRDISSWASLSNPRRSQEHKVSISNHKPCRHAATKAKGAKLFSSIKSRPKPTLERIPTIIDESSEKVEFFSPEKCESLNLSRRLADPPAKTFVGVFDVPDEVFQKENDQSGSESDGSTSSSCPSRRPSGSSMVSDLTLPKIFETDHEKAASRAAEALMGYSKKNRSYARQSTTLKNFRVRDRRISYLKLQKRKNVSAAASQSRYHMTRQGCRHGLPSLSPEKTPKYFGEQSRVYLYDTYRDLDHIRKQLRSAQDDIEEFVSVPQPDLDQEIDEVSLSAGNEWANEYYEEKSNSTGHVTLQPLGLVCDSRSLTSVSSQHSKRTFDPSSPRAKYLAACLKQNIPPRAAMILRDKETTSLWLDHQGMGDQLGIVFAKGLADLPNVTSVNLTDNNLTDKSLTVLINTIATKPSITELNLSNNVVGSDAADALATYLRDPSCTIKKLVLRAANVDDSECHKFVDALGYNRVLEELDMSENLLGKDENLNAVKPDIITAGESLAVLLHDCRCPLQSLKIAWNMIRMEGAMEFCRSLQYQRHLKHLDISFNSLGRESGVVLGNALLDNEILEELYIANNNIDGAACFAICVGIREGRSMKYLNIDGNPIGEAGGRILMTLPVSCGARVTFSAKGCDFNMHQEACWFDKTSPTGDFELDMEDGYELAVFYELLDIVAKHPSYTFAKVEYGYDRETKHWDEIHLCPLAEKNTKLSASEANHLAKLKRSVQLAQDLDMCKKYFELCDVDNSGELCEFEFFDVVDKIGFALTERQKASVMSIYDTDHSGAIQIEEFIDFISEVGRDSALRVRDIETIARCAEAKDPKKRYIPPRRGIFRVSVVDSYVFGDDCRALTSEQCENLVNMAKNTSDAARLLQYAAQSDQLRMDEAQEIFNHVVSESGDPAGTMAVILPHMASAAESKNMTSVCAPDDEVTRRRIRAQLGNAYKAIMGLADGFYALDLSKESDRLCMTKLLEISTTCAARRRQMGLGDVSQDGNWSSFRNEYFSGREVRLTSSFLTPMPEFGKIEFDFVGSERPSPNVVCITDRKLVQTLVQLKLLTVKHVHWAYDELSDMRSACKKALVCPGASPYWQASIGRVREAQDYKYKIYSELHLRSEQLEKASKREQFYSQMAASKPRKTSVPSVLADGVNFLLDEFEVEDVVPVTMDNAARTPLHKSEGYSEWDDDKECVEGERTENGVEAEAATSSRTREKTPSSSRRKAKRSASKEVMYENGQAACANCARIVDDMEQAFATKWIYARHLALIAKCFRTGTLKKTDFGTYRVELIVSLFCRIKDSHNFDLVLASVTAEEHGMLMARLGILNIFDPLRPEGGFCLDLSTWEERQVVKMLVHFAAVEPGVNWWTQAFQFDRSMKRIPGWELPVTWYSEEGLPKKGLLSLMYYAGSGLKMHGCSAVKRDRQALLSLVLHRASLVRLDDTGLSPFTDGMEHCTLEAANQLLLQCGADIKWNYDPVSDRHE